ncbi:aldo/keto reductase [Paenibacillus thalictri]|uniref:Aldo/keto reductase n=1 Tax=Paenibacillus thalictri TaxID=2527873 RepID=A0A4Q9E0V3_9BACL|nr:aldo/keto reductase [Paenibacillus thalictri]TBL81181.1 aldo/keto reductase [Paenibacillus thalictri]
MVDFRKSRTVGRTSITVNQLGLGTGSLGFLYEAVSTEEALGAIQHAFDKGVRFFDTAALYGEGLAEQRLGQVLSRLPREAFTVATKAGYVIPETPPETIKGTGERDYSYDGIMRSFEASLKRLGLSSVDILHIHDADDHFAEAMEGAYRAADELRSQGVIRAVGAGMNQSAMLARFAQEGDFDCFLLAGRYTLLDQSGLQDLMPIAERKGISIFAGGPLNSGILADPYSSRPMFNYEPASQEWVDKARGLDRVCQRYNVPLKAAAMQFPLAHPAVVSVLTGARSGAEITDNINMLEFPIPPDLWKEMKHEGLLPEEAPVPAE